MKLTRTFPAEPRSVAAARRFVKGALADGSPQVRETVELLVSELATNCIRHANAHFELMLERTDDAVHVEVRDHGAGRPAMRSPAPSETSGRGLRIVDLLATRWGVRYDADAGKTVWCTLAMPPTSGRAEQERSTQAGRAGSRGSLTFSTAL